MAKRRVNKMHQGVTVKLACRNKQRLVEKGERKKEKSGKVMLDQVYF